MHYLKSYRSLAFATLIFFLTSRESISQSIYNYIIGGSGDDAALSSIINNDNSITLGGHTNSFQVQSYDLYLLKLGVQGNIIWNKTYGNFGMDGIREIKKTSDNGYILGGYSGDGDYWDFLVMKVDSLGNASWAKSIGGFNPDECLSVSQTKDNGFIATGHTKSYGAGGADIFLVRYDQNGNILWNKAIGQQYNDWAHFVLQTKDNGYAILGYSDLGTLYVNYDIVIIKTDSLGNLLWANAYGLNGDEYSFELKETSDGGFVVAGYTVSSNIFLFKTDSLGTIKWSKRYIANQSCSAYSLSVCKDGGFIIGGQIGADALIIRTDAIGNTLWTRKYAGNGSDSFGDVKETSENGFIACGNTSSGGDFSTNIFVVKMDSVGESVCPSSPINLTTQQFTPSAYPITNFQTTSAGVIYDWTFTVRNPSPSVTTSCIIPVELILLDYEVTKGQIKLFWATATELNNHKFEIYRNGILVGSVEGHGTTSSQHDYSFFDKPGSTGEYIYRLLQIDYDGTRNEIGKLKIEFNQTPVKSQLEQNYPNPFNPTTKINFALPQKDFVTLKVFDLLGKEVATLVNEEKEAGYHEVAFDGSKLPSGIYIYTIITNGFSASKKLMLIK